jgi:hypothetical protein
VQETILQDFTRRGFQVLSVYEADVTSDDPTRVLIRQILGAFFEYERKCIVSKLRGARDRIRKATGRCEGRQPFGARPGEDSTLSTIKLQQTLGWTCQQISDALNASGIPTRYGKKWHPGTISKILAAQKTHNAQQGT